MRREEIKEKVKKGKKEDSKFIEKSPGNYKSRYKGMLSPEKEIVDDYYSPSYKKSRY